WAMRRAASAALRSGMATRNDSSCDGVRRSALTSGRSRRLAAVRGAGATSSRAISAAIVVETMKLNASIAQATLVILTGGLNPASRPRRAKQPCHSHVTDSVLTEAQALKRAAPL